MLGHRQDNARVHMTHTQLVDQLVIRSTGKTASKGRVQVNHITYPCVIGKGGVGVKSREGDGITPVGCWKMAYFLYRADRIQKPHSLLSGFAIRPGDSWCDLVTSRHYNRPLAATLPGSSEALWRQDNLYDIVIVLDHNTRPAISGRGSAIFIHLSGSDNPYTQGCIALDRPDLLKILYSCGPQTKVQINS